MPRRPATPRTASPHRATPRGEETELRIIGGRFRGRKLRYTGEAHTRPMKDRVREAVFNLIGAWVPGKRAIDLFAGTGALGLEALSRGAVRATFVERHHPTAAVIRDNAHTLGCGEVVEVVAADTFFWVRQCLPTDATEPWVVFCSPPWDLFVDRSDDMLALIAALLERAPAESLIVVEADTRFDPATLPRADEWRLRDYPPARIATWRGAAASPAQGTD